MGKQKRVVIIGAGINGLVCACYLARAGYKVAVLEKRKIVGGCCVTDEETFPGFKVSSAAYANSLFLNQIVEELGLRRLGYEVLTRDPSSFTPLPDGRFLFLGKDRDMNTQEIAKFSTRDSENYHQYENALDKIARFVEHTTTITPPHIPPRTLSDIATLARLSAKLGALGPAAGIRLAKLMTQNAVKFLDSWFESDTLKATLLTDAVIGAAPGNFSSYILLHHVMGEAGGARGVWGYQKGGMGGISQALAKAAAELGVHIETGAAVKEILLNNRGATGVALEDGEKIPADCVVSNADPYVTFLKLLPRNLPWLEKFTRKVKKMDFSSASMKVNLVLSGLPSFRCCPGTKAGPQHRGTIHISPSVEYIVETSNDGARGVPSRKPMIEITIPSAVDPTLAPNGCHVMNIFVQYTPYALSHEKWTEETKNDYFKNHILGVMRNFIENIDNIILGRQIISPADLENDFSLTGGNIFHGAMNMGQLFHLRPVRGFANYRTPIQGLYLCGAGTHPGGGVIGANGLNASKEIINQHAL